MTNRFNGILQSPVRHENAQPQQHKIGRLITKSGTNFFPSAAGLETYWIRAAAPNLRPCLGDCLEFAFSPAGEKQRQIDLAVLGTVVKIVQPMDKSGNHTDRPALP